MKNIAFAKSRAPEVVSGETLAEQMVPNYEYSQDEVYELLCDSPKMAVFDCLHKLVARGVVWRITGGARVKYMLLEGERLQEAIEQKTSRGKVPDWMTRNLAGYDAAHRNFRALCEITRKN